MPSSWIDTVTPGDIIGAVLAFFLIGSVIIVLIKLAPLVARISRITDLILGRKPEQGIPGVPSMVERFDKIDGKLKEQDRTTDAKFAAQNAELAVIKAEVMPNHGSSSHDKITGRISRVEEKVDAVLAHLGLSADT